MRSLGVFRTRAPEPENFLVKLAHVTETFDLGVLRHGVPLDQVKYLSSELLLRIRILDHGVSSPLKGACGCFMACRDQIEHQLRCQRKASARQR